LSNNENHFLKKFVGRLRFLATGRQKNFEKDQPNEPGNSKNSFSGNWKTGTVKI